MIELRNLQKTFIVKEKKGLIKSEKKSVHAVKDISMNISEGSIVGLLGVNGAGKTTTIKMTATLLTPSSGTGSVDGLDLVKDSNKIKKFINMVAGGDRMIYSRLTAKENLIYFARLYNLDNSTIKDRIEKLLRFVGLQDNANQPVETFSKGMKQRLHIARGLINDPKYILMDEPTIGLDVSIAKDLRSMCKDMAKNYKKGILLTSHYISEIEELCDYVYVIDAGRITIQGSPEDVAKHVSKYKNKILLKVLELNEGLRRSITQLIESTDSKIEYINDKELIQIKVLSNSEIQDSLFSCISKVTKIVEYSFGKPSLEEAMLKLSEEK